MSQYEIIIRFLEKVYEFNGPENAWVREYTIRGKFTDFGFIGARGDRNVRDLIKKGKVEAKFDGKYRVVRYKPIQREVPKPEIVAEQLKLI